MSYSVYFPDIRAPYRGAQSILYVISTFYNLENNSSTFTHYEIASVLKLIPNSRKITRPIECFYLFLGRKWHNTHNGPKYLLLHEFRIIGHICDHCWSHVVTLAWNKRSCFRLIAAATQAKLTDYQEGALKSHLCLSNNLVSRKCSWSPYCEFVLVKMPKW